MQIERSFKSKKLEAAKKRTYSTRYECLYYLHATTKHKNIQTHTLSVCLSLFLSLSQLMSLIRYVPGCHSIALTKKNVALMGVIKLGTLLGSSSNKIANGDTGNRSRDLIYGQ
jgi:hypothetical protein